MLPLFKASLFPDVCEDENRGRKIRHWVKTMETMQRGKILLNRMQIDQSNVWNWQEMHLYSYG